MNESVIKKYYDGLSEGKIFAKKCHRCGKLTFPPTSMCEFCGSSELEWTEISGKGKLLFVSHGITPPPNPRFAKIAPYAYGHVCLDEGIYVQGIVTNVDIDPKTLFEYYEKGPVDVVADIMTVEDLPILAFKVV